MRDDSPAPRGVAVATHPGMDAERVERVWLAAALRVAEVELRRAQVSGDRRALARWRGELEALELRARILLQGWEAVAGLGNASEGRR